MITTWIITIITFFLGYGLAVFHYEPDKFKSSIEKAKKKAKKLGVIKRPTAEDIRKRGTVEEAGEQAMEDTFEQIIPK